MKTLSILFCVGLLIGCTSESQLIGKKILPSETAETIIPASSTEDASSAKDDSSAKDVTFEFVGSVGQFSGLVGEVAALLDENGIDYMIRGSLSLSIAVEPERSHDARTILREWRDEHHKNVNVWDKPRWSQELR